MYRYLNLPFPTKPDLSYFENLLGCETILVNPKTQYKIIVAEKDLKSFRGVGYDKEILLKEDYRFDFQDNFETWFEDEYSKMGFKLEVGGISVTRPGSANIIHSDSHFIGDFSRTKINFTFSDYNSYLEYVQQHSEDKIYQFFDEKNGCKISCLDEPDCDVIDKLYYETWFPVLLDVRKFHRRNNRSCKGISVVLSYNLLDSNNNFVDFETAKTLFQDVLIPEDYKFNLLSDV